MSRNLVTTSIESLTGSQIAKTILASRSFSKGIKQITGLTLYPDSDACAELKDEHGVQIVEHKPGDLDAMPATKKAGIPNVCLISSAGCDLAEREAQPLLRSVIYLEAMVMEAKGDASTETGHSPVVIR
ncbi:hypothetical protein AN3324.2 [Aspergillus nidulans FGSC A4]|uniref:NAD(P)-binding domain-containing protein n=1 Tax=Emericella nidulans (strain FGSC A4 / ATCC 38163 / CBS 112.46 / NRRL 194 / M139) TaxID=227321 RepID=Q5B806_EMENI|nr:hypothetical protein [Aspergillus nidulans FGSC A4]EAA63292.1 hypothetical protein AN3324.2 [Aspergillus nidulans FGSC A4]CBF82945.1 TPA: hypothetical protein ANIA_03324 [Aspergillus nidulans FGSC A4]|eukprot:XP_660928.1 hypothetical protein AN3324.2 [Aspergillus nidulans FGSC A4]